MGFFFQLRLLLWKNYTLKKRSPWLIVFEILIPLILFLVLMSIRLHKQPYSSNQQYYSAKAMPSAGIIPLLQSFCPNSYNHIDKHGYIEFPNASIGRLLDHVVGIYGGPEVKGIEEIKQLKEDVQNFVDDHKNAKTDSYRYMKDFTLASISKSPSGLKQFLVKNLSISEHAANSIIHSSFDGKKLSAFLLERRYETFMWQARRDGVTPQKDLQNLQRAVLLQALFDPDSLFHGPTWMKMLSSSVSLHGIVEPKKLKHLVMNAFLGRTSLHGFLCNEKYKGIMIMKNLSKAERFSLHQKLCNLTSEQYGQLSRELRSNLNFTAIMHQMRLNGAGILTYRERILSIQKHLKALGDVEKVIYRYNKIAHDLNFNTSKIEQAENSTRANKISAHAEVLWQALGPVLCGSKPPHESQKKSKDEYDFVLDQGFSIRALKFTFYVLLSHPKILYAPNGTQADLVVARTAHFLKTIEKSRDFAKHWLDMTKSLRKALKNNSTQNALMEMQKYSQNYPHILEDWKSNLSHYINMNHTLVKRGLLYNHTLLQYLNQSRLRLNNVMNMLLLDKSGSNQLLRQLSYIDRAAEAWVTMLKPIKFDIFYGFPTEEALMQYYKNTSKEENFRKYFLSAILFDNMMPNGSLPRHVMYRIRMNGQLMSSTRKIRSRNWYPGPNHAYLSYYFYGFMWLQDQLERAISEVLVGRDISSPGLYIQEMPYPCYLKDQFMFVIQYMMPLCITVSFIYSVAILVQNIVYEKEQRLKEVMKMMGLSNAVHWTAWFITSTCLMTIIVLLMTIILKYGGILKYSDPVIIWLFLTLSSIATTLFCFFLSVFFSKAKLAAACGGIIYFLTYMPYVFISIREGAHVNVASAWKTFASLFSTTAFGLGARYFALYEQDGKGLQWENIAVSPLLSDEFNLGKVFAMLITDMFLYGILTWYIEAIHPGSYGLPRPWYFPFQLSYWLGTHSKGCGPGKTCKGNYSRMASLDADATPETPGLLAMDAEPVHMPLGVSIDELVKVYKGGKKAVDHMTLNLYEGQITSFLGHNGAGKTTTMSILTGLFPPTDGTAFIYGNDIRTDMDKIRTSLGMCPQHNVLFERLTVEEHLWFYARLKGMPAADVGSEIDKILEDLALPSKRNSVVQSLSGGMKRKLSVAMAFVGGSRTVILDEPTAGVDPYARRAIWDLLVKYKQGRTILLSTHFMDEADILGDRVAIISCGKLRCCGSPLFLKSQFGDGYHLTLVKNGQKESSSGVASSSQSSSQEVPVMTPQEITAYIRGFVPEAQLICHTQFELSYILPKKNTQKSSFKCLFESLESNKEMLGSQSFGLTDTTMEEVFLKVTEASTQDESESTSEFIGEITATLPLSPNLRRVPQRNADSGIDLDDIASLNMPPIENRPKKVSHDDSAAIILKGKPKRSHRRSLSSDFFRGQDEKPVVTCVHRRNPCGRYCGHRRALSSDFQIDKAISFTETETEHKNPIRSVLFGHRKTPSNASQVSQDSTILELDPEESVNVTKVERRFQQFYGLLIKRFHHSRRNIKGLISQIFLPAIFVCIAMTVAMSRPGYEELPKLILSPSMIRPLPNYIPFNNEGSSALAKKMENTLRLSSGVGADCVLKFSNFSFSTLNGFERNDERFLDYYDALCRKQLSKFEQLHRETIKPSEAPKKQIIGKPKCYCAKDKREYICDQGVEGHPDIIDTITGDQLLNVTGMNMPRYLMYTTLMFKRHRYGGLTFGEERKIVPKKLSEVPNEDVKGLFVRDTAKAWFNNKGYHAMPTYLNALSNTVLRAHVEKGMGNPASYGITAAFHPFSLARNVLTRDYIRQGTDVVIAIFVIIAMSFVPASFVIFLVTEKVSKAKHLQFVSGVNPVTYWLANYLWDMCNYLIPAIACMLILYFFDLPAYASSTNFPAVCCLFLLYGWSITPLMYPAVFVFKEASTAYVVLIVVNLFVGVTFTVTVFILQLFPDDPQLKFAYNILRVVSLAFPNYCLGRGLMDLAYTEYSNAYYRIIGETDKIRTPFEWGLISRSLVVMAIEGILFFTVTLLIEYFSAPKRRSSQTVEVKSVFEDEDVAAEDERVLSGDAADDILRMENLTKVYHSSKTGKHLAVDRLCLGVSSGECFGLLGVNGAGKTSTFKMLTGDIPVTAGDAFVENKSIINESLKVHKLIGYCPQFDALIDELTAAEHLTLYARLRGIPEASIKKVVDWAINKLALGRYAYTSCKTYSGGNKRKLSAAIALIGNPPLIFMDEPTTGMDPGARRFLWNLILSIIRKKTRSVILTSHSMEECEALCTRLAIMVNGKFRCLGSTQHLKNKFGEGYMLAIRVKGDLPDLQPVRSYFEGRFPEAMLKEVHHNLLHYQIHASSHIALSDIFECIEEADEKLEIEDYSVSQTTLENVFINFAKHQQDSAEVGDLSFIVPNTQSVLDRVRQRLKRVRRKIQLDMESRVQFSRLLSSRQNERDGENMDEEDEDSILVDFSGSNVQLEMLEAV